MDYSIIIPLFNEEKNVETLLNEIQIVINKLKDDREFVLIFIDDGSTDSTFKELLNLKINHQIKILKHKINLSQSTAIYHGIKNSKFENLIFLDGDCQNDPNDLIEMIGKFENGFDIVHGYRNERKDNFH